MTPTPLADGGIAQELVGALAGRKLVVAIVWALTVVTAYVALQFVTEQYESDVRLLVKLGRENAEVPVSVDRGSVLSTGVRKEEVNSEIQLLLSRDLVEAALRETGEGVFRFEPVRPEGLLGQLKYHAKMAYRWVRSEVEESLILLGLRKRLTDHERVVVLLEQNLKAEREKDSDVIGVRLRLPDPDLAARFLEVLVRNYLERRVAVRRDANMSDFFSGQLESYRQRLEELGSARQALQVQRGIASVTDQRALALRRQRQLEDEINDMERERKVIAQGRARERRSGGRSGPAPSAPRPATQPLTSHPSLELLKTRLTELRIKRGELLQRYKQGTGPVGDLDAEIFDTETLLLRSVESILRDKRTEVAALRRSLGRLSVGEKELDSVEQERQVAVQNFLVYAKRREEARISEELDVRRVSNIAVLSQPKRPIEPVYPRKLLLVGLSVPLGLALGLGLALLLEYGNQRVRTAKDLRALKGAHYLGRVRVPEGGWE